jgi:3-deoxy-D-manno-octulosonic-acid transferase
MRILLVFYSLISYLLVPFMLARLWWRGRGNPAYRARWAERFGFVELPETGSQPLWIHAVSVGEVLAALPLIRELRSKHPALPILVTTTTPTGAATLRRAVGDDIPQRYWPYDLPDALNRFLGRVRPRACVLMETELWPNLLAATQRRRIPVVLANARLSARSARRYRYIAPIAAWMLRQLHAIAAQSPGDAQRFIGLGADPQTVSVTGNLKVDLLLAPDLPERAAALKMRWGETRPAWVAASTHAGEEELLLQAHARLRARFPEALLVLVPRHPERSAAVEALCQRAGFAVQRYSQPGVCGAETGIFLVDVLGVLLACFSAADMAFIGGSLIPHGGHNLLEPALLGLAPLSGPHNFNFAEARRWLLEAHALTEVHNAADLADCLIEGFANPEQRLAAGARARGSVTQHAGASIRSMELIGPILF